MSENAIVGEMSNGQRENGRTQRLGRKAARLASSVWRSLRSEPVGLLGAAVAAIALLLQFGDSASRRDVDANVKSQTEAAYNAWFDSQDGWRLWVTAQKLGENVMAPSELEIRPIVTFPLQDTTPVIGEALTVPVTEFDLPRENELYRVVVENLLARVCGPGSGNEKKCAQGEVEIFLVTVKYGEDEQFVKRAFEGTGF
ncbi:MAG: hypothetical protein AAFO57_00790 [Pseudomonadota bacterium]